jgi:hypothetical protein
MVIEEYTVKEHYTRSERSAIRGKKISLNIQYGYKKMQNLMLISKP